MNVPVPCLSNWPPIIRSTLAEFRKLCDAEWIGTKPLPDATYSSSAFSCDGVIESWFAYSSTASNFARFRAFRSFGSVVYEKPIPSFASAMARIGAYLFDG